MQKNYRTGPRCDERTYNFYQENFKTVNAGTELAISMFPLFYGIAEVTFRGLPVEHQHIILNLFRQNNIKHTMYGKALLAILYDTPLFEIIVNRSKLDILMIELWAIRETQQLKK